MPISRPERVDRIIEILSGIPEGDAKYISVIISCEHPDIDKEVFEKHLDGKFCDLVVGKRKFKGGWREGSIKERRRRIAMAYHRLVQLYLANIDKIVDYIFTIEDDTETNSKQIVDFINTFDLLPNGVAFINMPMVAPRTNINSMSGAQVGRWGADIIGAWRSDEEMTRWETMPYMESGVQSVTATGLFFTIHKATSFLTFQFNKYSPSEFPLGPDVFYGYHNSLQTRISLINWDFPVGHDTGRFILRPNKNAHTVTMRKESGWQVEISSPRRR